MRPESSTSTWRSPSSCSTARSRRCCGSGSSPRTSTGSARSLALAPESAYTAVLTGPANLVVAVVARDNADLYRFITDQVGRLPVRSLETSPVLRRVKQAGSRLDGPRLTEPDATPTRGR